MTDTRTTWGRTRSGRSPWPLALGIGLAGSVGLGLLVLLLQPDQPLLALIVAILDLPIVAILVWVLVVDRSTLRGAVANPDDSVESTWLTRASSGAFFDVLTLSGLAAFAFSLVPALAAVPASAVLCGLTVVAMVDVGLRVLIQHRRAA